MSQAVLIQVATWYGFMLFTGLAFLSFTHLYKLVKELSNR